MPNKVITGGSRCPEGVRDCKGLRVPALLELHVISRQGLHEMSGLAWDVQRERVHKEKAHSALTVASVVKSLGRMKALRFDPAVKNLKQLAT